MRVVRDAASGNPAEDRIARKVYDSAGFLAYTIDEIGAVTQLIRDGAGRVTDEIRYATPVMVSRDVDAVPLSLLTDLGEERRVRNLYDSDGKLRGTLDAEHYLIEYVYDAGGHLTQQERQQVNREQNHASQQIYNDRHNDRGQQTQHAQEHPSEHGHGGPGR